MELYGVESCRDQRNRYQTPLNLLIYKRSYGNYERVTDWVHNRDICLLTRDKPFNLSLST